MGFFTSIESLQAKKNSLLCVGLDPRVERDPLSTPDKQITDSMKRIVDATVDIAIAYKPNIAFYEVHGTGGLEALVELCDHIPDDIPIILDAKRSDIGATAENYATEIFRNYRADATTIGPYMGRDALEPFLEYNGRAVFVVCRSSNPSARELQDLEVEGEPLYVTLARIASSWSDRVGLVVAGNDPSAMAKVRAAAPQAWFLAPGIGAQGGDIGHAVKAGARADGLGVLPTVSRSIAKAADPGKAARELRDAVNKALDR